jgi:hypothetical protein
MLRNNGFFYVEEGLFSHCRSARPVIVRRVFWLMCLGVLRISVAVKGQIKHSDENDLIDHCLTNPVRYGCLLAESPVSLFTQEWIGAGHLIVIAQN